MERKNLLRFPTLALFLGEKAQIQNPRCIEFTAELAKSLDLFNLGFLANYFPQTVALTASLLMYLLFLKAFAKPKPILAILSLPITYLTIVSLVFYLTQNVLSYCW